MVLALFFLFESCHVVRALFGVCCWQTLHKRTAEVCKTIRTSLLQLIDNQSVAQNLRSQDRAQEQVL